MYHGGTGIMDTDESGTASQEPIKPDRMHNNWGDP
jgi:hypothetical protein